jgi:glycosyltransferase involved in cell wall biosynthesis
MRIVMVAPQVGDAFGQERVISRSCELLTTAGHEVHLVAERADGTLPPHRRLLLVPGLSSFHTLSPPSLVQRAGSEITRFLEGARADIVHLHDCFDFRFLHSIGKRYATLLTAHTVAPTCPSSVRLTSNFSPCTRTSGWACIPQSRTYGCLGFLKSDLHRAHAVHSFLLRRRALRRRLQSIIAISDYVERTLLSDGWEASRIRRIPNPVELVENAFEAVSSPPLFVFAARVTPLKGLETLLRGLFLIAHREWRLQVCGEGPERGKMERLAADLQLGSRVQFSGRLSPADTRQAMARATAVVAPNQGPETFGLSVAEACALGVPVIAARLPALDELIAHEKTGLTFDAGDATSRAACLTRALEAPEQMREWARVAQEDVRARFSPEAHLLATVKVYAEAMERHAIATSTRHNEIASR